MQTYLVVRRSAWPSQREQRDAEARSNAEAARMAEDIASIRSYVLEEHDRTVGSVCVIRASSPETVRRHAAAADLPIDEIVRVADTTVLRPDPAATAAERGETNA
jgi:Nickel responsive protein SCO4226-like